MYIKYFLLVLVLITVFLNFRVRKAKTVKLKNPRAKGLIQAQGYENTRLDKYFSSKNPDYELIRQIFT